MFNPSHSMVLSPILNKRRNLPFDDGSNQDSIALEANQLLIRSPTANHDGSHINKRARYEPSWTLDNLCTHPCSPLAAIDLESIFNMSSFQLLSQDKRNELCSMLPDVDQNALLNHDYDHLGNENYNPSSFQSSVASSTSSNNFFSKSENPIFWNSVTEWQTMLAQGELMDPSVSPPLQLSPSPPTTTNNSSKSTSSCRSKTHHRTHRHTNSSDMKSKSIPCSFKKDRFKDDTFETYWGDIIDKERAHNVAGDSKSITLKDMCRKGLIREQDVIVYKRNFSACKVVVSKSMTVVKACGLSGISIKLGDEIFEDFETPTALETKILDHHGKVTKDKRPNGNAFKSIRLIRAGRDMGRLFDIRKDGFGDQSGC